MSGVMLNLWSIDFGVWNEEFLDHWYSELKESYGMGIFGVGCLEHLMRASRARGASTKVKYTFLLNYSIRSSVLDYLYRQISPSCL